MGKSLIIKGADFSANSIPPDEALDITQIVADSPAWAPQYAIAQLQGGGQNSNTTRCCINMFLLSLVPDFAQYRKLQIEFMPGYDYVMGISSDFTSANTYRVKGDEAYDQTFSWVSNNQKAVASLTYNDLNIATFSLNIRYDNNTTSFPADAKLSDYMTIKLLP